MPSTKENLILSQGWINNKPVWSGTRHDAKTGFFIRTIREASSYEDLMEKLYA